MRLRFELNGESALLRVFSNAGEIAYMAFRLQGPRAEIEFPSDWHERPRAWIRLSFVLFNICFSFPWRRVVPDAGQCSGPRYGFAFFGDALWLYFGKDTGRSDQRRYIAWYLPWSWEHVRHDYLNPDGSLHHRAQRHEYSAPDDSKRKYPFHYTRANGAVQDRTATINGEEREWRWRWFQWLPWPSKIVRSINIEFDAEVGESTGSWKGGTVGCGADWHHGESMEAALRRMERERKFR